MKFILRTHKHSNTNKKQANEVFRFLLHILHVTKDNIDCTNVQV